MSKFINRSEIKFVFIDWFGILSTNFYWCKQSKHNPHLKQWCDSVFDDETILNQWMRGKYDLDYLVKQNIKIEKNLVLQTFLADIEYYEPDQKLLKAVDILFPESQKILVTDNISLFNHILEKYTDLDSYFHKMFLSHELGYLKADSPYSLFDHILKDMALADFTNCVLIDDNKNNCLNFRAKGGRVLWMA